MKHRTVLIIIFICLNLAPVFGQSPEGPSLKDFPRERVFVHFNSSLLVSGENLYYKIYCFNPETNRFSNHSKIAYIELINTKTEIVFRHQIKLESGKGTGDFFVNTSIPSGTYKLIAYTRWMRNEGVATFFKNDIAIINPYRANRTINTKHIQLEDSLTNTYNLTNENTFIKRSGTPDKSAFLELTTNKQSFVNREKVVLSLQSLKGSMSYGNYSVSVRKIDTINIPIKKNAIGLTGKSHLNSFNKSAISFLPELRGVLLSGKVTLKKNKEPVSNIRVALSIPDSSFVFKIATTNKSGVFYFNLDEAYERSDAIVQVIHSNRNDYALELNNDESPDYQGLSFYDFKLSPQLKDVILKKSISNQIENAYLDLKNDDVEALEFADPIYGSKEKTYFLKDYTRFKTLRESITEVVDAAYVSQNSGRYSFHVKFYDGITNPDNLLPLVLIDGVLIQNHNDIVDYNAKNIKSIGIVRSKYISGGEPFMGIISIRTQNGDYDNIFQKDHLKHVELDKPLTTKKYFNQIYKNGSDSSRIPDYRNQLLWHPNLTLNSDQDQIVFYTSDDIGDYEICIEGFTDGGEPVSIRTVISVKVNR